MVSASSYTNDLRLRNFYWFSIFTQLPKPHTFEWRLPIGKKMLFQIIVKMMQPIHKYSLECKSPDTLTQYPDTWQSHSLSVTVACVAAGARWAIVLVVFIANHFKVSNRLTTQCNLNLMCNFFSRSQIKVQGGIISFLKKS